MHVLIADILKPSTDIDEIIYPYWPNGLQALLGQTDGPMG